MTGRTNAIFTPKAHITKPRRKQIKEKRVLTGTAREEEANFRIFVRRIDEYYNALSWF